MKNFSIFPHEIKYSDLVMNVKEQYQVAIDAINHDDMTALYQAYLRLLTFETLANVYHHASLFDELEMTDDIKGIHDEVNKLEVNYKENYDDISTQWPRTYPKYAR